MTVPATVTDTMFTALDRHVERLDGDRWRTRDLRHTRMTMLALCGAGLLRERFHIGVFEYAVTEAGLREYCARNGHDFDTDRPAPDGCQRCDAVVCPHCDGVGDVDCYQGWCAACDYQVSHCICDGEGVVEVG